MQNLVFYRIYTLFKLISSTAFTDLGEQGDWHKEQISISHLASVSGFTFYFVSSPASIHGPGQQSCTNVSIIPVLSGKLSLHARFLLELRCLHICHICFHPFCFLSTLHSFLPSFSPCPSFTLSLQSFSVSLSRLQNLKQKWVRAFRLVT